MKDQQIPIIQIRNCLLVSIQTELHDRLALDLQESLMERVRVTDAKGVILDVSAVEVIDSYITRILNDIGKSVRFMGAVCYIVGIRPAVAMTLIEMGVELDSVHTALTLDLALEKLELLLQVMRTVESEIGAILSGTISAITQRSIFNRLGPLAARPVSQLSSADRLTVMAELENSVRLFARRNSAELIASCARVLGADGASPGTGATAAAAPAGGAAAGGTGAAGTTSTKKLLIEQEKDIATARLEAWSEAVRIGLSKFTSVKVATAVSELARNIVFYAGKGTVELRTVRDEKSQSLQIIASDTGPGIAGPKLEEIWAGTYKSQRGMGKGLVAVKKLVDEFQLDTMPGRGTTVTCMFRGER